MPDRNVWYSVWLSADVLWNSGYYIMFGCMQNAGGEIKGAEWADIGFWNTKFPTSDIVAWSKMEKSTQDSSWKSRLITSYDMKADDDTAGLALFKPWSSYKGPKRIKITGMSCPKPKPKPKPVCKKGAPTMMLTNYVNGMMFPSMTMNGPPPRMSMSGKGYSFRIRFTQPHPAKANTCLAVINKDYAYGVTYSFCHSNVVKTTNHKRPGSNFPSVYINGEDKTNLCKQGFNVCMPDRNVWYSVWLSADVLWNSGYYIMFGCMQNAGGEIKGAEWTDIGFWNTKFPKSDIVAWSKMEKSTQDPSWKSRLITSYDMKADDDTAGLALFKPWSSYKGPKRVKITGMEDFVSACPKPGAKPKPVFADFLTKGSVGGNTCPEGSSRLTEAECRKAAPILGMNMGHVTNEGSQPKGCFSTSDKTQTAFFNKHGAGHEHKGYTPLCKLAKAPAWVKRANACENADITRYSTIVKTTLANCKAQCSAEKKCSAIDYFTESKFCSFYMYACKAPKFNKDGGTSYYIPFIRAQGGAKVVAGKPFIAEVLYYGKYYPICGHYFWDGKNEGPKTVCKYLGLSGGKWTNPNQAYDMDAMPVGGCKAGEPLYKCTAGGNAWGNFDFGMHGRAKWCRKGNKVKILITCSASAGKGKGPPKA